VPAVVAFGLLARMPLAMGQLALVLLLRDDGWSYGEAGIVVAAYTIALALAAPLLGRLVDRLGQRAVLVPAAIAFPVGLVALTLLTEAGAPLVALAACGAVTGATLPPLEPCIRALLPVLAPTPELRATAYAIEATLRELIFIGGPIVVALVATLASPAVAVGLTAGIALAGTLAFAALPAVGRWAGARSGEARPARGFASQLGALVAPGVRTVLAASLAMGVTFGALQVAMPAFGEVHGSRTAGGLANATFAAGSLVGGMIAAALPPPRRPDVRYVIALALFAAGLTPLLLAWSIPALMAGTLVAGLAIAPAFAAAYGLIDDLAPTHAVTEAFAWMGTAITGGFGLGTALGGAAVSGSGVTLALALAVAGGTLAVAVAATRRATLSPA
jgi:MFS family permease